MKIAFATVFASVVAAASAAGAMTVTIGVQGGFGAGTSANIASARAAQAAFHGSGVKTVETFEGFTLVPATGAGSPSSDPASSFTAPSILTSVGTLTNITPNGSGTTDLNPDGQLHVRNGSGVEGSRFNTTLNGANYLDSNDNSGMLWTIPGDASLRPFSRISFLATDIDDVGNPTFKIVAGNALASLVLNLQPGLTGARPNGELLLFTLLLSTPVNALSIAMNIDKGDGFSIDDLTVEQIPLPAAAWLMLTGVGVVASFGRTKRRARQA